MFRWARSVSQSSLISGRPAKDIRDSLPAKIFERPKTGFTLPIGD